jgi:hypothetical protein
MNNDKRPTPNITLDKAIELGEYDPNYLATFPEWQEFSRHIQFEYIKKGLQNRRRQIIMQYSELNNVLDLRNKPQVKEAIKNVEKRLQQFTEEREKLFIEYSDV